MSYLNSKQTVCEEWRVLGFEPGKTPLDRSPVEAAFDWKPQLGLYNLTFRPFRVLIRKMLEFI